MTDCFLVKPLPPPPLCGSAKKNAQTQKPTELLSCHFPRIDGEFPLVNPLGGGGDSKQKVIDCVFFIDPQGSVEQLCCFSATGIQASDPFLGAACLNSKPGWQRCLSGPHRPSSAGAVGVPPPRRLGCLCIEPRHPRRRRT